MYLFEKRPLRCLFTLLSFLLLFGSWAPIADNPPSADKILVAKVEFEFYRNLGEIDKVRHRNLTGQFKRIFKKRKSSPYALYLEFTAIEKKANVEAVRQAVATGYREREYSRFIGDIKDRYVLQLMNKYTLTIDLRNAFRGNYCFCYRGKNDNYCSEGKCRLPDGNYWSN